MDGTTLFWCFQQTITKHPCHSYSIILHTYQLSSMYAPERNKAWQNYLSSCIFIHPSSAPYIHLHVLILYWCCWEFFLKKIYCFKTAMPPLRAVIFILEFFFLIYLKIQKVSVKCVFSKVNWIKISFYQKCFGEFWGNKKFLCKFK